MKCPGGKCLGGSVLSPFDISFVIHNIFNSVDLEIRDRFILGFSQMFTKSLVKSSISVVVLVVVAIISQCLFCWQTI